MSDNSSASKEFNRIVARAREDQGFKEKLLTDTMAALKAEGIVVPSGITVKVVENTDTLVHVILPPPASPTLSDEALGGVVGGADAGGGQPGSPQVDWKGTPITGTPGTGTPGTGTPGTGTS